MAGSYRHVNDGISMIEDMGDAIEAIEELYYLVSCFVSQSQIDQALAAYYQIERVEVEPKSNSKFGKAYFRTKRMLDS